MLREELRELVEEYCQSLALVRKAIRRAEKEGRKHDLSLLRGMERDLEWTIEYMLTGYPPEPSRPRRYIPIDPQKAITLFRYQPQPGPTLKVEKVRLQILEALDILSEREREAFLMVVGEGLSYGETAKYMGVSKATVQEYVRRAKEKISARRVIRSAPKG